ncbi:MAG: transposase, partial [Candidatus Omnitrophica bacterium]|nr:transposase [Candidatus Omnitrophota bacterium]
MPNHVHGIIMIVDSAVGANNYSPTKSQRAQRPHGTSKTIGSIIRGFKIGVTKWVHQNMDMKNVWQRNYYEHIVRNEPELARTREYIKNNPIRWGVKKGKRFFALRD